MPTILIVDDTDFDRQVAAHVLRGHTDWKVLAARGGVEALQVLSAVAVDLVISDVQMPGMTGLDLMRRIRSDFPQVPVIIVTSFGSEALAVEALREGAASYIPKANLQRDLAGTVESVLSLAARSRSQAQFLSCLTHHQQTFEAPNAQALFPHIVGSLQDCLARFGLCDDRDRVRVGVAVEEALLNALIHGNLEVSSELRERADDSFTELVEARKLESPYRERRIHVTLRADRDEAMIQIRDQGPGFDISKLPDPTLPENLGKCSGRGILLMRTFFDEVIYNDLGNQVTMVKRRKKPALPEMEPTHARPHRRTLATAGT